MTVYNPDMRILSIVAVIGALQGFIILLSILFKFRHRKNLPLTFLLIVFSLRLATIPTWNPDILLKYPWIYPLTAPLPFLFGPFLWWYIRELVSDTLNLPKPLLPHFLPYILEVLAVSITLLLMSRGEYEVFIHNVFSGNPPMWLPVRNSLKVLLNIIYIVFAGRLAFGKKAKRLSRPRRLWLRSLIIIPSLVLASFVYVAVVPAATKHLVGGSTAPFFILSLTMAALIYGISLLLLIAPDVSQFKLKLKKKDKEPLCSDSECEYLVSLVQKRLSEGAFHNPGLLLTDLAAEFAVHPNRLSFAINHCLDISFRTLLNTKRLEYFSARVSKGALEEQSILELAFEAGFPSKSTFNRIFKEQMGMSPSEYRKPQSSE